MFENDYNITGKHATYLKFLAAKNSGGKNAEQQEVASAKVFERYIDVYMNAAVWGLLYDRTAPKDNTSDDRARIYADAFAKERENCKFLYRLVMLLDKQTAISPEERIDRAFRYDVQENKKEEFAQSMELFHSYVRGGIEELYEQFTEDCSTRDDYMGRIYDVIATFKEEIDGPSYEDELAKMIE